MHDTGKKLLELMFRPGETVCVSHNKYGYHSLPLESILEKPELTLVPTQDSCAKRNIEWAPENFDKSPTDKLLLVALNPIKGWREDVNCYKYRNFMVEMDYGPLKEQLEYIKKIGLPYSAAIFSGGKSLHFLISVDADIPNENLWRIMSEWTLNIATAADPLTKNPSRSIRIPGAYREPGKKQMLVDFKGVTKLSDFTAWLAKHPDAKPKHAEKRKVSETPSMDNVKHWVKARLLNGLDPNKGRNIQWFAIACEFALAGYSEDDTIEALSQYFTPDRDFKEREWKTSIHSAFKHMYGRK